MSLLRRLLDVLGNKVPPPHDERSVAADRIERLQTESDLTLDRVDRLVPPPSHVDGYRRVQLGRR